MLSAIIGFLLKLVLLEYRGDDQRWTVQGPEECHDEVKTVISQKPEEECVIEPQKQCKHVTKLLPQLQVCALVN